jgi:hypothetical protein
VSVLEPRRRASVDIKLLRLELLPRGKTPCETISHEWSPAQPTENLSPELAAASLKIDVWSAQSTVRERYRKLQLRYPPEQFTEMHLLLRPSFELLSDPVARLNWYWQSGLIPLMGESSANTELSEFHPNCLTPSAALSALVDSMTV